MHSYIIGSTGTGKSTHMECELVRILESPDGVVLIDPHGSFSEKVVGHIPSKRSQHLTYIDLGDREAVAMNYLADHKTEDERDKAANDFVSACVQVWGKEAVADRSQYIIRNSLKAIMEVEGTLADVPTLLTNEYYRRVVVSRLKDRHFWEDELPTEERRRDDWISPVLNKFDALLTPPLRRVLGQKQNRIDLQKVMDGRILIVNLNIGKVGEIPARIFGSLLISQLSAAVFARSGKTPCHLYVDEFQKVITPAFATILAEARKYNLNLTLANQSLSTDEVKHIAPHILANVGEVIAFRCGYDDGQIIQRHMGMDSSRHAIQNLANYTAYRKYLNTEPYVFNTTLPPPPVSNAEKLIQNSRIKFGRRT